MFELVLWVDIGLMFDSDFGIWVLVCYYVCEVDLWLMIFVVVEIWLVED